MKKTKDSSSNSNSGTEFKKHQQAIDTSLNEKIKNENNSDAADQNANKKGNRDHTTDVSQKKTGGGKQKSPGD